jgi:hypothetical protein
LQQGAPTSSEGSDSNTINLDFIQKIAQNADESGGDPALYSVIRQNGAPRTAFEVIRDMPRR